MTFSRTPERPVVPPRPSRAGLASLCVLVVLAASGCKDAPTDPMVGVVADESASALALGMSFADPASLAGDGAELGREGARALEAWRASWMFDADEGHVARERVYPALAEALARTLEPAEFDQELTLLTEALVRARGITAVPPRLAERIARAEGFREVALAARGRREMVGAVEGLVRGADALREIGPEAMARSLHGDVEAALGRISVSDSYSEQDLERARRLVSGAREAIEGGAWVLAIRRAYYARALLGIER